MKRLSLGVLAATAVLIAIPSGASAATTLGETFTLPPIVPACADRTAIQTVSPGASYTAPSDGVITRWSHQGSGGPPAQLRLKVGRPAPGADLSMNTDITIIGQSGFETPLADQLNSYFTRLPVLAGDRIGFFATDPGPFSCPQRPDAAYTSHTNSMDVQPGGSDTFNVQNAQLNVSAILEPDCDKDGLGDETQDSNLPTPPCPTQLTCKGEQLTIVGTDGPDEIVGTPNRDVIGALDGNDKVRGLGGKDRICGGKNKDTLKGGKAKDKLFGQKGRDKLRGGGAKDVCKGGKGDDSASKCEVEKSI